MKYIWLILLAASFLVNIPPCQVGRASELAATPPMGWNSWNSFGRTINEATVRQTAQKVSTELKRFGWEYIVIDEGWYISNPQEQDANKFRFVMTEDGRLLPDSSRFPSALNNPGFKPLSDYIHSLGLKFGIHILRGIPKEAVKQNLPIAGSEFHARDAADESDTCPWCTYNFGRSLL